MRRDWPFYLSGLLLLATVGGIAWLSHHPESQVLIQASEWPLLGPLAQRLRSRDLPPPPPSPVEPTGPSEDAVVVLPGEGGEETILSVRAFEARPRVWITHPTPVREAPSPTAAQLAVAQPVSSVVWLERRGDWFRVQGRSYEGWVYLEDYSEVSDPPLGREAEPVLPVSGMPPEPERLKQALDLLEPAYEVFPLGPYTLYSDSPDRATVLQLCRVVEKLEPVYEQRYGLELVGGPAAAVVVFASSEQYESYKAVDRRLADLTASGHVAEGIVATYRQGRRIDEVRSTVIHELVHLLNRRGVGPALPTWLDEGMAQDLAGSRLGPGWRLLPGTVARTRFQSGERVEVWGPLASLHVLIERLSEDGELPSVESLVRLDWETFQSPDRQLLNYAMSAYLVRYLLASELAPAFQSYLAEVARGGDAGADALKRQLGVSWEELDRGFGEWVAGWQSPLPGPS